MIVLGNGGGREQNYVIFIWKGTHLAYLCFSPVAQWLLLNLARIQFLLDEAEGLNK